MKYYKNFTILNLIALVASFFILIIQIYLYSNSLNNLKKSMIEHGKFITYLYDISNRFILHNNNANQKRLEEFTQNFLELKSLKSLTIYTNEGNILLEVKKTKNKPELYFPENEQIVETSDNIIITRKIRKNFRMGMMGMMRMMWMHRYPSMNNPNLQLYISLTLGKDDYNKFKNTLTLTILVTFSLVITIIISNLLARKQLKLYIEQEKKLKLMEKNAELGNFANLLAHEIKNPLSSMNGLLSYLMEKSESENREILKRIDGELNRLNSLVNDFLTFGREIHLQKESLSISELINSSLKLVEYDLKNKNLSTEITVDDFNIHADRDKMIQVLLNLLINAIDASAENDKIIIIAKNNQLTIINNLKTAQNIDIKKIFTPFYTTKSKGSGLGLTIVKKIVELHGFEIKIINTNPFEIRVVFNGT